MALTFTGGVSLAIWMGGVAREVDLLMQASDLRNQGSNGEPGPCTDQDVRGFYRGLLDLMDQQVTVDVLSGTSAGGINAALLGVAAARCVELDPLRELWLSAGSLRTLLRDPRIDNPPSLLQGDGQMLAELSKGIESIRAQQPTPWPNPDRKTDVFITTTLLSPEHSRFTDDYGTELEDTDHHGQFHFTETTLPAAGTAAPTGAALALAARSSASFPLAFEPAFIPFTAADADATHPDMSDYANTTRSHWAADGGLLINRPLGPMLQTIFDRAAERQVRRCLLYVTPTTGSFAAGDTATPSAPLDLLKALIRDAGAALNQSIAADLAAIQDHNDRAQAASDIRLQMARLGSSLPEGTQLAGQATWDAYLKKEAAALSVPVVAEIIRALNIMPSLPPGWGHAPANNQDNGLRQIAMTTVIDSWPKTPPREEQKDTAQVAAGLGLPAYDGAKATALRLIRLGYQLASTAADRHTLAGLGKAVHDARSGAARPDLRAIVTSQLAQASTAGPPHPSRADAVKSTVEYVKELNAGGTAGSLAEAWRTLAGVVEEVVDLLENLVPGAGTCAPRSPLPPWKAPVAAEARTYVAYLKHGASGATNQTSASQETNAAPATSATPAPKATAAQSSDATDAASRPDPEGDDTGPAQGGPGDTAVAGDTASTAGTGATVTRLLALYVSVRAAQPVLAEVEQQVELIQVSGDTRSLLSRSRSTAHQKLTGAQVHNFGAFYKGSWRANDWMWGRLDACGWLVHVLLDPRRILAVLENDPDVAEDAFLDTFTTRLATLVGAETVPDDVRDELGYLADLTKTVPTSLPTLSMWVAQQGQLHVVQRELPIVAGFIRDTSESTPSASERAWLNRYDTTYGTQKGAPATPITREEASHLLDTLPVPDQTLAQERALMTPLFLRTLTQTGAVAIAAATAMNQPPATLRLTFATARSVTRTAYAATNAANGRRPTTVWISLLLIILGVAGMLTNSTLLGVTGLVATLAGALLLAICLTRPVTHILQVFLAMGVVLLAALPWLPTLEEPFFNWLSKRTAWTSVTSISWLWVVLLLLVLLPPATTLVDLLRRRNRTAVTDPTQHLPPTTSEPVISKRS